MKATIALRISGDEVFLLIWRMLGAMDRNDEAILRNCERAWERQEAFVSAHEIREEQVE